MLVEPHATISRVKEAPVVHADRSGDGSDRQILEPPKRIEVADGVYLFIDARPTATSASTATRSSSCRRDGVLVFDTNGTPAAAAAVLAEIRKLTDQPVPLRRQLALALGSLVRHRGLHGGVPGRAKSSRTRRRAR